MPIPLALAEAPQGLLGLYQLLKGNDELTKLHQQAVPAYAETNEMKASRARAERLAESGYTPAETAQFRKDVGQDINTKSQRALDIGGGSLGKVIGNIGKIDTMGAESKFAANDAALHRQNIQYADKFSQQLQNLSNMNIEAQLRQRLMAEQALGGAIKTGTENLTNALGSGIVLGIGGGMFGGGGGNTNANPTVDNSPNNIYQLYNLLKGGKNPTLKAGGVDSLSNYDSSYFG